MIDLKLLQNKQLEIMDDIHKVCVNNNIRYYLIAGSCLGAIRHGGFIPWDVDIDIAMPRHDYEIFFAEACKELKESYVPHTYLTDEDFEKSHGLVCLKNSVLLTKADMENSQIPKFGVFIDVFPLDICPTDKNLQYKHKTDYLRVRKLRELKFSRIYSENGLFKKGVKKTIRFLLKPLSVRTINRWQQEVMMRYSHENTSPYWCSMASKYKYEKQLMPKDVYGKPTLVKFENREYYMPERPHDYLSKLYGDYMKLPPIEEQERLLNYFKKFSLE